MISYFLCLVVILNKIFYDCLRYTERTTMCVQVKNFSSIQFFLIPNL